MARIVLTCWGSHGDVDPYLGLGLALRARGHDVVLATVEYYRKLIETSGLEFRPVRPDVDPTDIALLERIMDPARGSDFLLTQVLFPAIEVMFDDISAAADGADLLVSHPVTFATPIVAAHRRLRWASAVLSPASMFSAYDYPVIPPAPWVKVLRHLGTWPGRLIVGAARRATEKWAAPIYRFRQSLGLPRGGNPVLEGQHSPHLVLALYSRLLGEPQADWPPNVVVTGHVFHDAPHGTALSREVERFLQDGSPPIVFTLGSAVVVIAKDFWNESIDAARRIGARALLLAGGRAAELQAQLDALGTDRATMLAAERAPHSLIFPRAAVVVQQCGIGTLAQSLRSGRPMLAVPYAHDQPDNAWRAVHLGMARTIYPRRYRAARVAATLQDLMSTPRFTSAATRVADGVRAETGVMAACDALERICGRSR